MSAKDVGNIFSNLIKKITPENFPGVEGKPISFIYIYTGDVLFLDKCASAREGGQTTPGRGNFSSPPLLVCRA